MRMRCHMICRLLFVATVIFVIHGSGVEGTELIEDERIQEFHARNHSWPPQYVPLTEGWKRINDRRFAQVSQLSNDKYSKYNGYLETSRSAITTPNFTENGWGLTRAPDDLFQALRKGVIDGFRNKRLEHKVRVIDGPQSWFIDRPDLTERVSLRDGERSEFSFTWENHVTCVICEALGKIETP